MSVKDSPTTRGCYAADAGMLRNRRLYGVLAHNCYSHFAATQRRESSKFLRHGESGASFEEVPDWRG